MSATANSDAAGKNKQKTANAYESAIGGAIAGVLAVTGSYPFDLIKTRLQFAAKNPKSTPAQRTLVGITKEIWKEGYQSKLFGSRLAGGTLGFYRGLDQLIPEAAGKVLLRFVALNQLKDSYRKWALNDDTGKARLPLGVEVLMGALAGLVETSLIVQPFERGKVLRADFVSPYKVWGDEFRNYGFGAGMRSIYTGFLPCACRQMGNQAVGLTAFYRIKQYWLDTHPEQHDLSNFQRLTFGFLSGSMGACATMPFDTAKSLAQKARHGETTSTIKIWKDVVQRRGFLGLYTGLSPRIARVGLDRAFGFLAFEWTVEKLRQLKGN